jgi:hypothetical protein
VNTSDRRALPNPSTKWLIIEILFASILYSIQIILKGDDINMADITKNIIIIYAILWPSEFIRQYIGTEKLKLILNYISKIYIIYSETINKIIWLFAGISGGIISTGSLVFVSIKSEKSLAFKVGFYVAALSLILETFIFTKASISYFLKRRNIYKKTL